VSDREGREECEKDSEEETDTDRHKGTQKENDERGLSRLGAGVKREEEKHRDKEN
jgi:hypothetical protein